MPRQHLLLLLLLLLLSALSLARGSQSQPVWYKFADSPEAAASVNATQELRKLQPAQRTLAAAVNLCHRQSQAPENFCAWVALDDGGRPAAVSCFNEWHRQCNRLALPLVGSPSGSGGSRFRPAECDLCSPCASGQWDLCPTCRRVCYCTCSHKRYSSSEVDTGSEDFRSLYQCHEFCDGRRQCGNGQDEMTDSCDYYKLAGSPVPQQPWYRRSFVNVLLLAGGLIIVGALLLHTRYTRYHAAMRFIQEQPAEPLLSVSPDPLVLSESPPVPNQEETVNLPPPPAYETVAGGK